MLEKEEIKRSFQGTEKALPHQKYRAREDREALGEWRKGEQGGGAEADHKAKTSDKRAKTSLS